MAYVWAVVYAQLLLISSYSFTLGKFGKFTFVVSKLSLRYYFETHR